jgi:chemotaxis protein MotB
MNDERPIIIVKKKAGHAAHHGGSWKVAYADFVTAMMAFFLVMWILGLNQDTRKSIAAYFNDPAGMMKSKAGGSSPISDGKNGSSNKSPGIMTTKKVSLSEKKQKAKFREVKKELESMLARMKGFNELRKHIAITIARDGLRIELLEGKDPLFFESGSADLKATTTQFLKLMGPKLATLPHEVILEGHTDARPYSGGQANYGNWELSSDRANSARRAIETGLRPGQIREVRGYGPSHLRMPSDPFDSSNRRISILVAYKDEKGVETQDIGIGGDISIKPAAPDMGAASH